MIMKAEILRLLRETDGYVSGQELCNQFGVSRTAVWKAINQLKEAGYEIEAVQNKGYHLVSVPDRMDEVELASIRKTEWAGAETYYFDKIDSTNTKAKELAEEGHPSGTFVVADQQTAGKGRRGRSWDSLPGTGIYMTLMLKPDINPNHASMLTLVTAMAVANAMHRVTGAEALIKWPNDIVINGKKICGILTEMSAQFDYINHIVIGIGINVHNESFPEELQDHAGSLLLECGKRVHRADLIEAFLEEFERLYAIYLKTEDLSALQEEYDQLLVNRGRQVRVLDPKEPFEGKAMGITKKGELIVDTWESVAHVGERGGGRCAQGGLLAAVQGHADHLADLGPLNVPFGLIGPVRIPADDVQRRARINGLGVLDLVLIRERRPGAHDHDRQHHSHTEHQAQNLLLRELLILQCFA